MCNLHSKQLTYIQEPQVIFDTGVGGLGYLEIIRTTSNLIQLLWQLLSVLDVVEGISCQIFHINCKHTKQASTKCPFRRIFQFENREVNFFIDFSTTVDQN